MSARSRRKSAPVNPDDLDESITQEDDAGPAPLNLGAQYAGSQLRHARRMSEMLTPAISPLHNAGIDTGNLAPDDASMYLHLVERVSSLLHVTGRLVTGRPVGHLARGLYVSDNQRELVIRDNEYTSAIAAMLQSEAYHV